MNKKPKSQIIGLVFLLLTPSATYAHGEQILLYLAPDVFWIVVVVAVLLFWEETRTKRTILTSCIILGGVLAWFLPFNYIDFLDHITRYIAIKAVLPLATGIIAYLILTGGKKRKL
jgi:hypothetical protein